MFEIDEGQSIMVHRGKPLIILQPTSLCNIDCKYCYLPSRKINNRMSLDTLSRIYHAVLGCQLLDDPIEFVWHAGEPLLASKDFYREAFEMAKVINSQYNRTFSHGIQTNGTLLDPGWVQLFKEYKIAIGVSIDGPEFIHDR